MSNRNKLAALSGVLLAAFLVACSSGGETKSTPAPVVKSPVPPPAAAPASPAAPQPDLSQHSAYFDFDKSDIKPDSQAVISNWGTYLVAHPTIRARVEGNCDERGTREYNIGLGERRANAVAQALEAKGVAAAQLDVISYGKEHPVALGHDETAWSKNRRVDLVQK